MQPDDQTPGTGLPADAPVGPTDQPVAQTPPVEDVPASTPPTVPSVPGADAPVPTPPTTTDEPVAEEQTQASPMAPTSQEGTEEPGDNTPPAQTG